MQANGIVSTNLQIGYGSGYVDKRYNDKVADIKEKAEMLIPLLKDCLNE